MASIPKQDNSLLMLLRTRLAMFLERHMFTDVTLVTNTLEIRAHSIVLAGASLFFESHLSFASGGDGSHQVPVPFDGQLVVKLVNYIYTGIIQFTDDVYDMMALQDYLQIGSLRNLISDHLAVNLKNDSVGKIVQEADKYRYADLATEARRFFASNFKSILTEDSFVNIQFELILESLESDYLVISSTKEMIYNLCRWVAFDESERDPKLEKFLNKINPIEIDEWAETKERCLGLFPKLSTSASMLNKWFDENSPSSLRTSLNIIRGSGLPRFKTTLEDIILFIGGIEKSKFVPTVEATRKLPGRCRRTLPLYTSFNYPIHEPPTLIFSSMRLEHCLPFVASSNGQKVFVTSALRNVECYHVSNNQWYPLPKFPESVLLGRITTLDDSLYICGPRVKLPGHELWVLPKNALKWKQLSKPCLSTGDILQFVTLSLGSTLVGFFASCNLFGATVQHYDTILDVWTPTLRLSESLPLITATPINRLKIFIAVNTSSWCCYDSVSCSLDEPIRASASDEQDFRQNLPCQCSDPHVNESILLGNRTVVQKSCCAISTYSLQNLFTCQNIEFRYGAITSKSNFALATVKIGSYARPTL